MKEINREPKESSFISSDASLDYEIRNRFLVERVSENKPNQSVFLNGMEAYSLVRAIREGEIEIAREIINKHFGSEGY